jgi:hypothetical protein
MADRMVAEVGNQPATSMRVPQGAGPRCPCDQPQAAEQPAQLDQVARGNRERARTRVASASVGSGLAPQALDEILGASVLPFGETLTHLIHHHARRAVLLQPAE